MQKKMTLWVLTEGAQLLPMEISLLECRKCHRKIMLTMFVNGSPHHIGPQVTCASCLELTAEFEKDHPGIVGKIKEWANASSQK